MSITETLIHRHCGGGATAKHDAHYSSNRNFDDYNSSSDYDDDMDDAHFSKRKFDDYSSSDYDDADLLDLVSVKMRKETETTLSQRLQFFVRIAASSKSLVIQASEEETVESVQERIETITGIPVQFQRLTHNLRQLKRERRLRECGIQNDATLLLVCHAPISACSVVLKSVQKMVSLINSICRGECECLVEYASTMIENHMTRHFDNPEYYSFFMSLKAPLALVTLYASPHGVNRDIANSAITHFLNCTHPNTSKDLQVHCLPVVLKLCKLLRKVGCEDTLYLVCRGTFGVLLANVGGVSPMTPKRMAVLQGIFAFVRELADNLLRDLDSSIDSPTCTGPLLQDVQDFASFLVPFRKGVGEWQDLKGICREEEPYAAGMVEHLRTMYVELLSKMDKCLHGMEGCLADKEQGEGDDEDVFYLGWSLYLPILKELYKISELFDSAEEKFWRVLECRRSMLSQLVVRFAERRSKDHWWILERKSVTTFETRRHFAMMLFPDMNDDFEEFHEMLVDRNQLLAESFEYIVGAEAESLQGGLFMEFKNEAATGPGVLREWFLLVCQGLFSPQNALFVACPNDRRRFFPNPASKVHRQHLEYFSFSGRIIALALMNSVQVGIVFDRVFITQLAGNNITLQDIRDADPYLYSSCKQILEMDADFIDSDALGLTFVREVEELGCRKVIELCPGGENLVVNSKNRKKYVDLLIQNRFVTSISEQVSHFAKGFADIISMSRLQKFFQILELEDLDWMLHGSDKAISVEDWKAHTEYNGYKETDCQISWFWEIVGRMSAEQRKVLLFFWTSVKYLPVEGFHGFASRLCISKTMERDDHLPSSRTCFYQLCFPPYSSMAIMQDRLGIITKEHIGCSFGAY